LDKKEKLPLCIWGQCASFERMQNFQSISRRVGGSGKSGLFIILFLALAAGFFYLIYLSFQAEDISDIAGSERPPQGAVKNLTAELAVGMSAGRDVRITEAEINRYLASTLELNQGGMLSGQSVLRSVLVRLEEGICEVVFVRELYGRPHTVSLHYAPIQKIEGGRTIWEVSYSGGRFGRMPVAGVFINLVQSGHHALAKAFSSELEILKYASGLRIEKGSVVVGPARVQ